MKNTDLLEYLKLNLYNACLDTFSVKQQFIELQFSSSRFEEINFYIDCKIYSDNQEIESMVKPLKKVDKDVYEIAYFIFMNLKHIKNCELMEQGNFKIEFSEKGSLIFDLNATEDANFTITFKKKQNDKEYVGIDFEYGGTLKSNTLLD